MLIKFLSRTVFDEAKFQWGFQGLDDGELVNCVLLFHLAMDISDMMQGLKEIKEEDQFFIPFQQWVVLHICM